MSYINDALKKAQQEKDSRYRHYDGIIAGLPGPRKHKWRTWLAAAVFMTLMLAVLFVWLAITGYPERPVAAVQMKQKKVATTGNPQAQAAGRKTETVTVAKTAAADVAVPVRGKTLTDPAAPAARFARKETAAPGRSTVPTKPFPDPGMLYREALAAQRNKKTEAAERLYRRVLTLDARHVEAMNNLGVLLMARGRQEQAVTLFHKAIAVKKDYVDPRYNLACLYAQNNDAAQSLAHLKSAVSMDRTVIDWAKTDVDLNNIKHLDDFNKLMETRN